MSVLDCITLDLGSTDSQASREATWIPGEHAGDGTLTILIRKGKKPGCKTERFVYAVQEEAIYERGVRSWLVEPLDGTPDKDTYQTTIGPRGDLCTCRAGMCGLACKHKSAMRALVKALDEQLDPQEAE